MASQQHLKPRASKRWRGVLEKKSLGEVHTVECGSHKSWGWRGQSTPSAAEGLMEGYEAAETEAEGFASCMFNYCLLHLYSGQISRTQKALLVVFDSYFVSAHLPWIFWCLSVSALEVELEVQLCCTVQTVGEIWKYLGPSRLFLPRGPVAG